jgi:anti-sigma factor RsiW
VADQQDDANLITAYLLGELSEQEQEQLEIRYFSDDELFNKLLAIEDELIDLYARGDITVAERVRLERHFLASPDRRKRVQLAKALLRQVSALAQEVRGQRLSWWRELKVLLRMNGSH